MSKSRFDSRYSIEYLDPNNIAGKSTNKKTIPILLLLTVISGLIFLGYFLWKQGFLDQFQQGEPDFVTKPAIESLELEVKSREPINNALNTNTLNTSNEGSASTVKPLKVVKKKDYSNVTGEEIFLDKCTYCHGKNGEGSLKDTYPKLRGQHSAYLLLQLKRMRDGKRLNVNPAMFAIIKKMDNKTLAKISDHIARIPDVSSTLQNADQIKLEKKLNTLTGQLLLEQQKNTQLEQQIKKNLQISDGFSKLYDTGANRVNKNDQDLMRVVQEEKNRLIKARAERQASAQKETITDAVASQIVARTVAPESLTNEGSKTTTTATTTTNQMDKIVSAIGNNNAPKNKSISTKRVYVEIGSDAAKKSVSLQDKINKMVSSESVPDTKFTKALKKEDKVRKNAVRSIVVRKGDTLWRMAERAYGNGLKYPKILKANPKLKRGKIVTLKIGQIVRVPK